ncbi:MAG: NADH-quinone oxidoreductase subunit J [Proteobacteria bacterium]|nr:NADH-quinone oxidoreductase subunit J [Pseudomonadota bacterium]MCL2307681.1 NADH-quinone oxidoreductase subunit J [Pseudomonadota bacterium]
MSFSAFLFYVLAAILLASAVRVVSARQPVHAALSLVLAFFTMAALWITLGAEFLGLALVVIYVGAVMVLFLFVLMMLDVRQTDKTPRWRLHLIPALAIGALMLLEIVLLIVDGVKTKTALPESAASMDKPLDNTRELGKLLFEDYLYSLELVGVLLLVGMIAAIVLTHRQSRFAKRQEVSEQIAVTRDDRLRVVSMPAEVEAEDATAHSPDKTGGH